MQSPKSRIARDMYVVRVDLMIYYIFHSTRWWINKNSKHALAGQETRVRDRISLITHHRILGDFRLSSHLIYIYSITNLDLDH